MAETYLGVDLGGTMLKAVIAGADGRILTEKSVPTLSHEGPQGVLKRIAALVNELKDLSNEEPVALGMGVPGLVDLKNGVTKFLPNLATQWRDVPVRGRLPHFSLSMPST